MSRPGFLDKEWTKQQLGPRGSLSKLARQLNRDRAAITRIANGEQPLQLWMVPEFAAAMGVPEVEILKRAHLPVNITRSVPIISWVAASQFAEVADEVDFADGGRVACDYPSPTLFALEVQGDSMDRVAPEGSLIVVDYALKDLKDRDLAVFSRDGETTFKRFRADDKGTWLEPESFSTRHSSIIPEGEIEIQIVGRVVSIPRVTRP